MSGKLWFVGGLAVGFVLGSRAGRQRYEEITQNARKVWEHPTVQEAAGVVQAQANRLYTQGKGTVNDKLSHTRLGERLGVHPAEPADEAGNEVSTEADVPVEGDGRPVANNGTAL